MYQDLDKKGFYFFIKISTSLAVLFWLAYALPPFVYEKILNKKEDIVLAISVPRETIQKEGIAHIDNYSFPSSQLKLKKIKDFIPDVGKFILADLTDKNIVLFVDGQELNKYSILSVGKPETIRETPSGFFKVIFKDANHIASESGIYMPYSVNFFGKYFIHGWPYYYNGVPVDSDFSGGCIRLDTADAKKVFDFSDKGIGILVWDDKFSSSVNAGKKVSTSQKNIPKLSAQSFLVAKLNDGQIFLEKDYNMKLPIASITKMMTAVVATEVIGLNKDIVIGGPKIDKNAHEIKIGEYFKLDYLLRPLLMESDNEIANDIANFQDNKAFFATMNNKAKSIGMHDTHFEDPSGISVLNESTATDLFVFARYLVNKEKYLLGISKQGEDKIFSESGIEYVIKNKNFFSGNSNYTGGKTGTASFAGETFMGIFSFDDKENSEEKILMAIILLNSESRVEDTNKILEWLSKQEKI